MVIFRDRDVRVVYMQKISSFGKETAEIARVGDRYYKSSLPQSELVRAVFFRRLPFKSFDTRDLFYDLSLGDLIFDLT